MLSNPSTTLPTNSTGIVDDISESPSIWNYRYRRITVVKAMKRETQRIAIEHAPIMPNSYLVLNNILYKIEYQSIKHFLVGCKFTAGVTIAW